MFYYTFSVIDTIFVPCTALLYDSTAGTRTLKLPTTLFLFWWCSLLSVDCFHKLCLSGTPSENSQAGWNLGNRMARGYRFDAKWVCPIGSYACGIQVLCSRNEVAPHFWNRTLEYVRRIFRWYRLISRQTDNPWPSYSQDLNPSDYFLMGYLKDRVCEINPQTREVIIRKEIRRIPQEMLNRVVDNFNVLVAAVLSCSSAVHGMNIVLITEKV